MDKYNQQSTPGIKRPMRPTLPAIMRGRKVLRLEDPSIEDNINAFLMASDESDTEEDIAEFLFPEDNFR